MKIYIILLLISFLIGCGTETGNPLTEAVPHAGDNQTGDDENLITSKLLSKVCDKINECYSVTKTDCIAEVKNVDGFDSALNLDTDAYTTYQEIIDAESDNSLSVNDETAKEICLTDIENLACNDSEVDDAYDPSDSSNFNNAHKIIPIGAASCQDIF